MIETLSIKLLPAASRRPQYAQEVWWEYFISGNSLKHYLGLSDSAGIPPFGWSNQAYMHLQSVRELLIDVETNLVDGRVLLYLCPACGEFECGSVTASVAQNDELVIWRDFAYTHDRETVGDIYKAAPIVFERPAYKQSLAWLLEVIPAQQGLFR